MGRCGICNYICIVCLWLCISHTCGSILKVLFNYDTLQYRLHGGVSSSANCITCTVWESLYMPSVLDYPSAIRGRCLSHVFSPSELW